MPSLAPRLPTGTVKAVSKPRDKNPSRPDAGLSRREWISLASMLGLGGVAAGGLLYKLLRKDGVPEAVLNQHPEPPAQNGESGSGVLDAKRYQTLRAACDMVLPGDAALAFTAASGAGVPAYIESLAAKTPSVKEALVRLCDALDAMAARVPLPNGAAANGFAELPDDLRGGLFGGLFENQEYAPYAKLLVELCVRGYLMPPEHGGNLGGRGWKALGLEREIPPERKRAVAWKGGA